MIHPNVYADLSGIKWRITKLTTFYGYLKDLIDAGLEDRKMFGTDGGGFPETFKLVIEGINSVEFLSDQMKGDIF